MENCELLADTGAQQNVLIVIAIIFIVLAGSLLLLSRRYKLKFSGIVLCLLLSISLVLAPVSLVQAQSTDECANSSSSEEGQVLGLVDDTMSVPGEGNYLLAILNNDQAPDSDPLDWQTVDLNPELAGQQTAIMAVIPDDPDFICGTLNVTAYFGLLAVTLGDQCFYDLPEDDPCWEGEDQELCTFALPLPEYVTLQYTANTLGGQPAPAPATVTIFIDADTPEPLVNAMEDGGSIQGSCGSPISGSTTIEILDNDTTTSGSLDPTTVDLNPSQPGRQTSVTVNAGGGTVTATVDNSGVVTITTSGGFVAEPNGIIFYYTVKNTSNDTSTIGTIVFTSCSLIT